MLDDDLPDHFNTWLINLNIDQLIEYAAKFAANQIRQAGKEAA